MTTNRIVLLSLGLFTMRDRIEVGGLPTLANCSVPSVTRIITTILESDRRRNDAADRAEPSLKPDKRARGLSPRTVRYTHSGAVQQESSRQQNGHSLSEMPVFISRFNCESFNSSRGGTRTPDPVINSHLLYHLSYSGIAFKISQSDHGNQPSWYRLFRK